MWGIALVNPGALILVKKKDNVIMSAVPCSIAEKQMRLERRRHSQKQVQLNKKKSDTVGSNTMPRITMSVAHVKIGR